MYRRFSKREDMEEWLATTDEGRDILSSVNSQIAHREYANHVLAVVHADRVDFYGAPNVRLRHIQALHCPGPRGEVLSETLVGLQLPVAYRELLASRYHKASLFPRCVWPSWYEARRWWWDVVMGALRCGESAGGVSRREKRRKESRT